MRDRNKWVLLLPFISFALGIWIFTRSQSEARFHFERARRLWQDNAPVAAISEFQHVVEKFPRSRFAQQALWEVATTYYFDLYAVDLARMQFEKIVAEYPGQPIAGRAHLRLAEIFDLELNEIDRSVQHWKAALESDLNPTLKRQVRLKIADAYFKMNKVALASEAFSDLVRPEDDPVTLQALVRIGTILQIQNKYPESIDVFSRAALAKQCPECQLQAQLGLIESYEFLDQLDSALAVADKIDPTLFSAQTKQSLVERLQKKRRSFGPALWTGN